MAWRPISQTLPQYMDGSGDPYSGAVLKAYASGTSTNINFATDSTGGTTAASIALNANGYPEVSGSAVIPHLDRDYKLSLYATQAAADADSGAIWTIDALSFEASLSEWVASGLTPTRTGNTTFTVSGDQTSTLHVGRRLKTEDSGGTDYATITAVSYSDPTTTVTVTVDGGGALDAGLSTVSYALMSADNESIPGVAQRATASASATIAFDGLESGYDYEVWLDRIVPATDAVGFQVVLAVSGTYQTGGTDYTAQRITGTSTSITAETGTGAVISLSDTSDTLGTGTAEQASGVVRLHNPGTGTYPMLTWELAYVDSGGAVTKVDGCGYLLQTNAIDGIRFAMSSGNIASGSFVLRRLKR